MPWFSIFSLNAFFSGELLLVLLCRGYWYCVCVCVYVCVRAREREGGSVCACSRGKRARGADLRSDRGMPEAAGSARQSQTRHMTPCACHCAACHAAGHGSGVCVLLCAGLHDLFEGQHDAVDVVLRQYYGACSWGTARFDEAIRCVRYGPAGDVIAAGGGGGGIHLICAQTGLTASFGA